MRGTGVTRHRSLPLDVRNSEIYANPHEDTRLYHLGRSQPWSCLARIKHTDDQFVLLKNGKPVAELVPATGTRTATMRAIWDALASVPMDESFADDLQAVSATDLDNPWDPTSTPPR